MHSREIRDKQLKYVCSDCGEAFDFHSQIDKHQDAVLKQCPGKFQGMEQTAFSGIARGTVK